jgi:calcineurin-like phosphoesterase family protein
MTTFFTSDLHLGHANILMFCGRPGRDVDEMNELIIDNWNRVVTPEDTVFVLGDVAMGKLADTLPLVSLLNGTKHLIAGNHDRVWGGHKKVSDVMWFRYITEAGFTTINDGTIYTLPNGVTAILSHFPYEQDDRHGSKYAEHHPQDDGRTWLLHGHVHQEWQVRGRQINVGVDVWGMTPVSEDVIVDIIERRRT